MDNMEDAEYLPVNFWNSEGYSNYRLRYEPINLKATITPVLDGRAEQTWENEGGAIAPPAYELEENRRYSSFMRVRGSRKQRAARRSIPKESITIVPIKKVEESNKVLLKFYRLKLEKFDAGEEVYDDVEHRRLWRSEILDLIKQHEM